MSRKIIISVIAIVLVLGVVGGCYALYSKNADDVEVNINAGYESVTLQLNNGADTGAQSAISLENFSPSARTQTVDVTLKVNNASLVDGVHGLFTVEVSDTANTLGAYLTTTVSLLDAAEGNIASDITTAATGTGYDVALSSTPKYVRISFYLNDDGVTNFATIADTSASLTLTWAHVAASVWTIDTDAYYIVGSIGGALLWDVTENNVELNDTPDGNVAQKNSVALTAGDKIKVRKGDGTWINPASDQGYTIDGDGNYVVGSTGNYGVFFNNGVFYVAAAQ